MEEMSFQTILNLLAAKQVALPILDCYYIKNSAPISFFQLNSHQKFVLIPESSSLADLLSKIYREIVLLQKLGMTSSLACFLFIKERRHKISVQDLEMILATGSIPPDIKLIQLPKPNMIDGMLAYSLTMDVLNKTQTLYFTQNDLRHKVNEPTVMHSILGVAKKFFKALKDTKVNKVEIDFVVDAEGQIWITFIKDNSHRITKSGSAKAQRQTGILRMNGYHNNTLSKSKGREVSIASPRASKKTLRKNNNFSLSQTNLESAKGKKPTENSYIMTNRSKLKAQKAKKGKRISHIKSKSKLSNCSDLSYTKTLVKP